MKKLTLILSLLFTYSLAFAQLSPDEIKQTLGNYPAANSLEEKKDIEELFYFQQNRTAEECTVAAQEESASFTSFFGTQTGLLNETEFNSAQSKMRQIYIKLGSVIMTAKSIYKRPRPYEYIDGLVPCLNKAPGDAYPSGHAASARVYALLLSKTYPERKELFLKRADEIARHRVLGGVHHPSDIEAGKKLAQAFVEQMKH